MLAVECLSIKEIRRRTSRNRVTIRRACAPRPSAATGQSLSHRQNLDVRVSPSPGWLTEVFLT